MYFNSIVYVQEPTSANHLGFQASKNCNMFRTNNKMQVLGVTFLLASSIVIAATLSTVGIKAYAADSSSQGNSTDNSHSNSTDNDRSYAGQNNANMTSDNNSTNSNPRSDNGRGNSNMTNPQDDTHRDNHSNITNEHHSMADQKREQYVSESAEQRHNEHISS